MSFVAKIEGVSHRYGKTLALDNVTLDIPAGRMIGMIGPDAAGKSTLLGLIAGVRIIQQGQVVVLGGNMANQAFRNSQIGRIAYMPQGLGKNLYPTLSVFENIDFHGRLFGLAHAERQRHMDELLKATSLDPFLNRPAGKLSGGMKQKLSLCCALIHDPDLLILDEPTTGVDPLSRRQFWELIGNIRARRPGMSVIVATAYMEEAQQFGWLCAMYGGKVIAAGKTRKSCKKPERKRLRRPLSTCCRKRSVRNTSQSKCGRGPSTTPDRLSSRPMALLNGSAISPRWTM